MNYNEYKALYSELPRKTADSIASRYFATRRKLYTDTVIFYVRDFYNRNNRIPTVDEYNAIDDSAMTVIDRAVSILAKGA